MAILSKWRRYRFRSGGDMLAHHADKKDCVQHYDYADIAVLIGDAINPQDNPPKRASGSLVEQSDKISHYNREMHALWYRACGIMAAGCVPSGAERPLDGPYLM